MAVPTNEAPGESSPSHEGEGAEVRVDPRRRYRLRSGLTWLLVVITSLSIVVSSLAVWVHSVVFDTDRFMETIEPALGERDFYVFVGDRAATAVLGVLEIEDRLTDSLDDLDAYLSDTLAEALGVSDQARDFLESFDRPSLAALAPPIAEALETRIDARIHDFFTSEVFVGRFPQLVRQLHGAALALARDELSEFPNVYIENGEVRLNLVPFIAEALENAAEDMRAVLPDFTLPGSISDDLEEGRQQLAEALGARLPDDFAQITVMSEETLSGVQTVAVQIDRLVWLLVIISLALIVLTIAVSPDRRNAALRMAVGVFVAIVLGGAAIRRLRSTLVEAIADPRGSALADGATEEFLTSLRNMALLLAALAVLVAVIAYLAGRPPWFAQLTEEADRTTDETGSVSPTLAWIADHAGALQAAAVVIAAMVMFLVGLEVISFFAIVLILVAVLWAVSAVSRRVTDARSRAGEREDSNLR